MPYYGSQTNGEFGAGTSPAEATGRLNHASIGPTAQYDTGWQDMERESGTYQAGSYPKLEDQLDQGSDDE
jgi:hypothetical protein